MSLEQKHQHWLDADDNEFYASELRTAAAVYIAELEAALAERDRMLEVYDQFSTVLTALPSVADLKARADYSTNIPNLHIQTKAELDEQVKKRLDEMHARAEEGSGDDEYPECEDCRNTGHPWTEGAEQGMSGSDYRYFCDCEQGRDMKAARAEEGSEDE